jgi:O-antigen ligase
MTTDAKYIKKLTYSLLFGAMIAGALVIFYTLEPDAYNPFQIPAWALGKDWWLVQIIGPFNYHDEAGGVLGFTVLIGYFLIRFDKGLLHKQILIAITALSLIGLFLSGSRSGWLFILFPLILSSLISKQKIIGIFLLGLVAIAILISVTKVEYFSQRVAQTISQFTGGSLGSITANRVYIWEETLSEPKMTWLLFGEGFGIMQGAHTHSNYLAMLKNTGLIGIIYWFILYKGIVKRAFWLMRYDPNKGMSALFTGVFWAYIGYFMFFLPSTPMMWSGPRYVDFVLMALVFLRHKQVTAEAEYVFEEESYQTELA